MAVENVAAFVRVRRMARVKGLLANCLILKVAVAATTAKEKLLFPIAFKLHQRIFIARTGFRIVAPTGFWRMVNHCLDGII
jgi:hypothetical protein